MTTEAVPLEIPYTPTSKEQCLEEMDYLISVMRGAKDSTESEYKKHKAQYEKEHSPRVRSNNWMSCFMTPVSTTIQIFSHLCTELHIPAESHAFIDDQLKALTLDVRDLQAGYPTVEDEVPHTLQGVLFLKFEDVCKEIIILMNKEREKVEQ